jgi:hypothetical protein
MLNLILNILSTVATLAIGIAASALAYQQFRISKSKLRFELYEKRLALFKLAMEFTRAVCANTDQSKTLELAWAFKRDTSEHCFLFTPDVAAYFNTLYAKANELAGAQGRTLGANNDTTDLLLWFDSQSYAMVKVFQVDLSIETLR